MKKILSTMSIVLTGETEIFELNNNPDNDLYGPEEEETNEEVVAYIGAP